jgi:phi13 family phage major tail protein
MATSNKKVRFGLKNAHYAVFNEQTGAYGTPKWIPGSVSLSLTREGETNDFFAEDETWASFEQNLGYSGDLEIPFVEDQLLIDLLGYTKDSNTGVVAEPSDVRAAEFALLFEQGGNKDKVAYVFYNCTLSRPEASMNTKSDSTDPDTSTLSIRMKSRNFDIDSEVVSIVKAYVNSEDSTTFNAWYSSVKMPATGATVHVDGGDTGDTAQG